MIAGHILSIGKRPGTVPYGRRHAFDLYRRASVLGAVHEAQQARQAGAHRYHPARLALRIAGSSGVPRPPLARHGQLVAAKANGTE
jgi:hypothetical protein